MAPLITLTTDFGTRDSYVAQLKAVLFSEGPPELRVVNLSHEQEPFDVRAAAWFVREALPAFPAGTVHVVVVNPGVGSARKPLLARLGRQFVVGPDNGVFGLVFNGTEEVFAIEPARLGARALSSTFHGRDLFAPAAARIAAGASCEELGARVAHYERSILPAATMRGQEVHGEVVHIDRYGNLISNLSREMVQGLGVHGELTFQILGHEIRGLRDHYFQGQPGELLALVGSSGLVELSLREGSAAQKVGALRGAIVRAALTSI